MDEGRKKYGMSGDYDCTKPPKKMRMMLAHAYVHWQCYTQAYCPDEALMKGTLFPELYGVYKIPE